MLPGARKTSELDEETLFDEYGDSVLHHAAHSGELEILKLLLEKQVQAGSLPECIQPSLSLLRSMGDKLPMAPLMVWNQYCNGAAHVPRTNIWFHASCLCLFCGWLSL